ncbi:MAG: fumarylacetoacetate hydrolase family protein [Proteobacteria bacterium]|nr:fumarylacetoacetate hydrolase family protein [Pseudomonadota bacterium]
MKLASFRYGGRERVGWQQGSDSLLCLHDTLTVLADPQFAALEACPDMLSLLQAGRPAMALLQRLHSVAQSQLQRLQLIPESSVQWQPPVLQPGKVLGVALNNTASDVRKISAPAHPLMFLKARTSLLGHGEDLVVRPYYGGLHPEPELGVVIGKRARDLDPLSALDCVAGYTIINDITGNAMRAEDRVHYWALYASAADPDVLERREQHLSYTARYKGSDGFCPCGPWLVTPDDLADPDALDVVCRVGGEVVAEDSTAFYSYRVAEVLAWASRFFTLEPGDILSMGTAFRPGAGSKRSLHLADLQRLDGPVEVSITCLGTLRNGVRRENPVLPDWRLPRS